MKRIVNLKSVLVIFFITMIFTSCDNNDNNTEINTSIIDVINENPNLSSLVAAIEADTSEGNILSSLSSYGNYTLLAPSNTAFETFLNGRALSEIPKAELHQVLLNHILLESVNNTAFKKANDSKIFYTKTAATITHENEKSNISIFFNSNGGDLIFNGISKVTQADIAADNGIVHIVDKVIVVPSIVNFVAADGRFSSLLGALTSSGQPDFVTILSTPYGTSPAPFTVFAPINDAFSALTTLPTGSDLTKVLQHHVIVQSNILSNKISNGFESPATLEGDVLKFSIKNNTGYIQDGAGNTNAEIIVLNVQANNGVIHAISKVLIPNTGN